MKKQVYELKNDRIKEAFVSRMKKDAPGDGEKLAMSWSNWVFGTEPLGKSAERLRKAGIEYIELHGNHYGPDLGYKPAEVIGILEGYGMTVSGICGMFSAENDLSSNNAFNRQAAVDYIKRELEFAAKVGARYMLIVPGAVGRPDPYDDMEFARSAETLRILGDLFVGYGIKAAIEPIRSAEVSIVHTVGEAKKYIEAAGHPGICHINGDVYHMQTEEAHIGEAILEAGSMLANLHMADSTRSWLGSGSLDLDTVIMALYAAGYDREGGFVTPEPLGKGASPYPAMYGRPDEEFLDELVNRTAAYFREREEAVLGSQAQDTSF